MPGDLVTHDRVRRELLVICLLATGVGCVSVLLLSQFFSTASLESMTASIPGGTSALMLLLTGMSLWLGRRLWIVSTVYGNALRDKAQTEETLREAAKSTTRENQRAPHPGPYARQHAYRHASIPVLLVDDHAMVRQGIRSVMESFPNIEIVGEASNGNEALKLVQKRRPAVVLMDINMPRLNGIEATAKIKNEHPEVAVIGLSVNTESANQEAMKKAGASMLLPKEAVIKELYNAIIAVSSERTA